jgi:hypothetical protein
MDQILLNWVTFESFYASEYVHSQMESKCWIFLCYHVLEELGVTELENIDDAVTDCAKLLKVGDDFGELEGF